MELKDILNLENLNGIYKDSRGKEWTVIEYSFNTLTLREVVSKNNHKQYIEEFYPIEIIVNLTFEEVLPPKNKVTNLALLEDELVFFEEELTKLIEAHIEGREKIEENKYQNLLNLRRRIWKLQNK